MWTFKLMQPVNLVLVISIVSLWGESGHCRVTLEEETC